MKLPFLRQWVVVLFVALGLPSFAQFTLNQTLPLDPNVKMGRLSNGLTYYIRKNTQPEKKVELRLAVNAGSVLEDADQRGLAHFMEHMSFNGSKHFPKNELVNYLQKVGVKFGADLNAYTGFDETVYILPIASDDPKILEQGFTVLEDWAFNNLLDKNEIDKERSVVLEESRLNKGAQQRMMRQYFPRMFNGSKYAERLPIGVDSILQHFKYASLEHFYKQWYRPDLMAVIVVGDINPADIEKKIKAHFGSFKNPAGEKPRPAIIPIKNRTTPEAMVLTDVENTSSILQVFNFIRPAKKIKTWADYRQDLVDDMVNQLINERLQELTTTENPPFVYGFTGLQSFIRGYETFSSFAVLGNRTAKEALNALMAETERARKFGFLPSEIDRVKAGMLNDAEEANKEKNKLESSQLVQGYLNNFLQGDPAIGVENKYKFYKQILSTITATEINMVAKNMPSPDHPFVLLMAPENMKDKLPSSSQLLKDVAEATKQTVKPYEEKKVASALMDNGPSSGKIINESKNDKLGTVDLSLSNGVTITLKPTTFKNDEILMDAWRRGGWQRFPLDQKENAQYAAQITTLMGVKDMTPTDLEKFLSGKTVSVTPYLNDYEEGIEGNSSIKDLETFLQLVNLYFTAPRKDQGLFNSFINKNRTFLPYLKSNPQAYFSDTLSKILYNKSPWVSVVPTEEEFNKLNADKALEIYNQVFGNADGMHFTFVGSFDPATIKPLLEKYLGSLPGKPEEHQSKDNNIRQVNGVVTANIKKGKEAKSMIVVQWSGATEYNREESMALKALIDVLNIKVVEKLREEMGGIYGGGFNGSVQKRPFVHYSVKATLPCGPENVDKLTTALFGLIKNAQDGNIEQKDLDKVKETWKKSFRTSQQENDFWLETLSQAFIDQVDPELVLTYEQRVNALTVQNLQKAANKFLDMKNYVRAVLYPENANVEEGVKKAF